jgi:streptomycin 6-kinase
MMEVLTVPVMKALYEAHSSELELEAIHGEGSSQAVVLAPVYRAERFLVEQYRAAVMETLYVMFSAGCRDKTSMIQAAVNAQMHSPDDTTPIMIEVIDAFLEGKPINGIIKKMILDNFESMVYSDDTKRTSQFH